MFEALFQYQFLRNALFSGLLASVACGIVGVIVIEKKLVMMSGGIAHTSYGGVGLGYLLGFEPILGAFLFSVLAAVGIGYVKRKGGTRSDVIVGLFWSLGMALGVLFIGLMPGYPPDLTSYLFGGILSVTRTDLTMALALSAIVALVVAMFYNDWKAYLFDEEFAAILGVRTAVLEYLLLILVAMTIVALIRVVGIILVMALLTAPAATAGLLTGNLKRRMLYAVLIGALCCTAGLWVSYALDIASGASIVVLCAACYFAVFGVRALMEKLGQRGLRPDEAEGAP
ncbi:MAG: Manganese transport system membrane protein MntB [Firmicutes bacterium ADurb.Bin248]|nr:MAG: Manganese transport system membrane protein MntB [Firmicutes bacterium ADurb.Bin248]HPK16499.1 metal ABC transporter permease [Clostridia bacterium]